MNTIASKALLLSCNETVEEHRKLQTEEAALVERDKANTDPRKGGLFRGCFRAPRPEIRTIRDSEDGVERCPLCNWEVEDNQCARCEVMFDSHGLLLSDYTDHSVTDFGSGFSTHDDLDDDVDLEEDETMLGLYGTRECPARKVMEID